MNTYTFKDFASAQSKLSKDIKAGRMSMVTQKGKPMFLALPFDERLVSTGIYVAMAIKLFEDGVLSLGKAAQMAGVDYKQFAKQLAALGIAAVDYSSTDLKDELAAFK